MIISSPSMLLQMTKFCSFFMAKYSIVCVCVCVCVCVYIHHIFFIHLSVHGHLGCFHILAIINNVAMNIGVHVSFRISVFGFYFGYIPRSIILGCMVALFLKTSP